MDQTSTNGAHIDLKRTRLVRGDRAISTIDRLLPHSPEAEQGALGCVLLSPRDCMGQCIERFKAGADVFYDLRHKTIWQVLLEMYNTSEAIDVITLQQRLKDKQLLEQVGGIAYLASLPDAVPSAANLSYYLDIVQEKFLLRKMIQTCTDVIGRVYDYEGEVDMLMDEVERDILAIRETRGRRDMPEVKELVKDALDDIESRWARQGAISGLSTGLADLDRQSDGLHGGELIVIAAFPSTGKTSIAMNIAEHVLLNQHLPVGVFTLEMTAMSLVSRFICSHARVSLRNISSGFLSERDFPRISASAGRIATSKIHFDDTSDMSIFQLRAKARRMWQQHQIKLFVVDYIQLLNANGGGRKVENRQQEVADISRGLKQMSKEFNVPVIALSQLNDDGKLRESRAIGQDADCIWMMERGDEESNPNEDFEAVKLWIRKNRNGPRDICVNLTFLKGLTRFENTARVSNEDVP